IGIKTFVIFEFNKNPSDSLDENTAMFIHINTKDGRSINADVDKKTYEIDGRWLSGRAIDGADINNIKSITSGTWDIHNGQRKSEYLSLITQTLP
ncbi:hypothetical protein BFK02_004720, partial [Salmonella enterica subsp. enterica serovar Java]|nr:hypothetical protein [Salmonella enterica subsp. enterica serovar Java]